MEEDRLQLELAESKLRQRLVEDLPFYFDEPLQLVAQEHALGDAGRLDILAKTPDHGLVVIELKVVTARREAIGQLASYMGAMTERRKSKLHPAVRGILVAPAFDTGCIQASKLSTLISLRKLKVEFNISIESDKSAPNRADQEEVHVARGRFGQSRRWTLELPELVLTSDLPFVATDLQVTAENITPNTGISTFWGTVKWNEIHLLGDERQRKKFFSSYGINPKAFDGPVPKVSPKGKAKSR